MNIDTRFFNPLFTFAFLTVVVLEADDFFSFSPLTEIDF